MTEFRQKGTDIRISPVAVGCAVDVNYVSVKPTRCWSGTWASCGKKVDDAIVFLDGKAFRVTLEQLA